ncbi:glycosyltransferase [Heyndrickxia sporothermodurans]|nr:glycosyltransferase [Heyndrickxia sporothermodurans]
MGMKKKVVHITTVHHPYDTRIYHKECLSLQRSKYDVSLIAPMEKKDFTKDTEINMISIKKRNKRLFRMILSTFEAYRLAKKVKADCYHIHDPELLPAAWLLKNKNNVVIYDIHEDYVTSIKQKEYIPKPIRNILSSLYTFIEKTLSRKMKLCLAEKYYKDKYPTGTCILNYPHLNKKLVNYSWGNDPVENKLLYTGNVTIDRGALVHAQIPRIDHSMTVHYIGKCSRIIAKKVYDILGEYKDNIVIEGIEKFIEREEIDRAYLSQKWLAGLALFPPTEHYKKKELTKFFEYMSAGIPIICSNFPLWRNFIDKYNCGIAVDPYNKNEIKQAIDYLKENPAVARRMGLNGKKAVIDELNWAHEEEKLLRWYEEILKKVT